MPIAADDRKLAVHLAAIRLARARDPWATTRRDSQTPPAGHWRYWLFMAGRGSGKTRAGAEYIRERIEHQGERFALVGPTLPDVRDVMVEGESGLIACCERYGIRARYVPSRRAVKGVNWTAYMYSADEPNRLRGPQHHHAWADELGAWRYGPDAWSNLDFGLRLGHHPTVVATSTPRVVRLVRDLVALARAGDRSVVMTTGSTWDNRDHLPADTLAALEARYAGTRLGRQELEGELLEDVEGALWTHAMFDRSRLAVVPSGVSLTRVVVAVDPPATSGEDSAECGIVVVAKGNDGRAYVLADYSRRGTPDQWARAVVEAFDTWAADRVVVEVNQGGEMVKHTLRTVRPGLSIAEVRATRGKAVRAEPIAAQYEQGKWSHVGSFTTLEDQMATWVPGETSPDRMDALVWAGTELMIGGYQGGGLA